MFMEKWLSAFVQLLVLIPSALSCYLPAKNMMRFSMKKTVILCFAVLIPFSAAGAFVITYLDAQTNAVMLPALMIFFFIFRKTVTLDIPKTLAIYVGVCAVQTFPAQFANIADMYLKENTESLTLTASLIHLLLSSLTMTAFIYPARNLFYKMVDRLEIPRIWYFVTLLSGIFLVFNIIAVPRSYDAIRETRLQYLFPALECAALALLVTIYVLFYKGSSIIVEFAELEKRSALLEIQENRFLRLQEYIRQTERMRHDFRHSVHILSSLAASGDLEGIKVHLSEYEQYFAECTPINYCSNPALNALFGYYREMADNADIKTDWRIELPAPLTVSELDMAALFGNIMENAIYACASMPREQRYFSLTSEVRHGNSLYIVSTNSFDGKPMKDSGGSYLSTKRSGRGTGLSSIAAAAEKYGGSADFRNSDKEFYVDVVLKI